MYAYVDTYGQLLAANVHTCVQLNEVYAYVDTFGWILVLSVHICVQLSKVYANVDRWTYGVCHSWSAFAQLEQAQREVDAAHQSQGDAHTHGKRLHYGTAARGRLRTKVDDNIRHAGDQHAQAGHAE